MAILLVMPTVELTLPHHRYEVRIGAGTLGRVGQHVREVAPHTRAALVVDEGIAESHGRVAARSLTAADYDAQVAVLPRGEASKTLGTVRSLYDVMLTARLERKSPVVAVGGGITGDTAGFVAATYLRGVPLVQVPTTLLSMVDASVGGKVGVNVPQGKNLIGAFWQPSLVLIDVDTLATLPDRQVRCGLAECVKHGVIRDPSLFDWIASRVDRIRKLDADTMIELVERNVRIKASVVMADEKETGERAHLNFGHTFAHAIEAAEGFGKVEDKPVLGIPIGGMRKQSPGMHYEHGEAVALGMVAATRLAVARGLCDAELLPQLMAVLESVGLPTSACDLPPSAVLMGIMRLDKKVADGKLRLVLPVRMGEVRVVSDVPDAEVEAAWDALRG
jgi:3-dehydroquinate synthase